MDHPTDADFQRLLTLRSALRRFLHWSEEQARAAGLTPAQHQLLLAVRGHPDPRGPRIAEIADYLALRHHSAVELIDRARDAGLVRREADPDSRSAVRIRLTPLGAAKLEALAGTHMRELAQLAPTMRALWAALERDDGRGPTPKAGRPAPQRARPAQ